ncbi:MAG: hypothetical protein J0H94_13405 [Rhizobiales bacterium]|nr:hypothetical protein [Hyphomicrobiales bacterium]
MRKRFAFMFATVTLAALTAAAASELVVQPERAVARSNDVVDPGMALDAATIDRDGAPVPVSGTVSQMFAVAFGESTACLSRDQVVVQLQGQAKAYGGQVVVLEDGLEQSFADQWRRETHVPTVKVSGVVAHLFGDRKGGDWAADVIEFDKTGCAMSRTLVPGDTWTSLLKDAVGVEV